MNSVIMAGGEGRRLRPVTCDVPKPLTRLAGRPVIEYLLDLLEKAGCQKAVLTLGYLPGEITDYFITQKYKNIDLEFSVEESPLGTAGSVKKAAKNFKNDFLVISGDCVCDFDLNEIYDSHISKGADITVVTTEVDDPREYGLISTDDNGFVESFVEKPSFKNAFTNKANTGIYVISPKVLKFIPDGVSFDFSKDLFPLCLSMGGKISVYEAEGYWCDMGDGKSYLKCQSDILNGRVKTNLCADSETGCFGRRPTGSFVLFPPVYFGDKVTVADGAVIGPDTVLDDGVTVEKNARIRQSALLKDAYIEQSAKITSAIVCPRATVKRGASLFEHSTLGSDSTVGEGAAIMPDVAVWPKKLVDEGLSLNSNLKYGSVKKEFFDDGGIYGNVGSDITPRFCADLGCAVGSFSKNGKIGVAFDSSNAANALSKAVISGMLSTGAQVWNFGRILKSQMSFACSFCGVDLGVYVSVKEKGIIELFSNDGLPVSRETERKIEKLMEKGEFVRVSAANYSAAADMSGVKLLYRQELFRQASNGIFGKRARAVCTNAEGRSIFNDTLTKLGCDTSGGMSLLLSSDGTKLNIKTEEEKDIPYNKLLWLCCLKEFKKGYDIILPPDAPAFLDTLAKKAGAKVQRVDTEREREGSELRKGAKARCFLRDGMMLGIRLLDEFKSAGELERAADGIPDFSVFSEELELESTPAKIMNALSEKYKVTSFGIEMPFRNSCVYVRPRKSGKSLRFIAESKNAEIARTACEQAESKVREILDKEGKR